VNVHKKNLIFGWILHGNAFIHPKPLCVNYKLNEVKSEHNAMHLKNQHYFYDNLLIFTLFFIAID
jgi:hypothetical protein